jgi:hypothetical protein
MRGGETYSDVITRAGGSHEARRAAPKGGTLNDTRHDANLKLEQEGWPPRHSPACEPSSKTATTESTKWLLL